MPGYDMTMEEFKEKLGDGKCFVALDGNRVVGMNSVRFIKSRRWCSFGKRVAYCGLDGIIKTYQGTDVITCLNGIRNKIIVESGVEVIEFNTAEHNKVVIKSSLKLGAKIVQYAHRAKGGYHPIVMAVWRHGCPYPDWLCKLMFNISKVVIKLSEIGKKNNEGVNN